MKLILSEEDISKMVKAALNGILCEESNNNVSFDVCNFFGIKNGLALFKTNSNHLGARLKQRNIDIKDVKSSVLNAYELLKENYKSIKNEIGIRNNFNILNKDVVGVSEKGLDGCLFISVSFYDVNDLDDAHKSIIKKYENTEEKDIENVVVLKTAVIWDGTYSGNLIFGNKLMVIGSNTEQYLNAVKRFNKITKENHNEK